MADFSEIPWIKAHIELYKTDPEKARMWDSTPLGGPGLLPTLLLTTTGRKSGKIRRTPLIRVKHGDRYVVVASKGGADAHPAWYLNLQADPEATLQDRAEVFPVRARTATAEEKEAIWPAAVEQWPDYASYQASTDRDIPVVILDPR